MTLLKFVVSGFVHATIVYLTNYFGRPEGIKFDALSSIKTNNEDTNVLVKCRKYQK